MNSLTFDKFSFNARFQLWFQMDYNFAFALVKAPITTNKEPCLQIFLFFFGETQLFYNLESTFCCHDFSFSGIHNLSLEIVPSTFTLKMSIIYWRFRQL